MATPSNHIQKVVPIYARVHPKGIEYSWDRRREKQPDWGYMGSIRMGIRYDPKRTVLPVLSAALKPQFITRGGEV